MIVDAIVVGAGLSGLVCARRLDAAGARVRVLEARDRVGGRLHNGSIDGVTIDLGGQWLTAGQPRLVALARELGVASVVHARDGQVVLDGSSRALFSRVRGAVAQWRAMRRIDRLMRAIPPGEPAEAPDAAALDGISLADWLARTIRDDLARERIGLHADLVFAADPAELSLLAYLSTMGATGGFAPDGAELPGGGREHYFEGGAQSLALALAATLDVQLGSPVASITQGDDVAARGAWGELHARRLVLAIPPVLVRKIEIELPPPMLAYVDRVAVGPVVKCFAAYARPFWRDAGLSGEGYRPRGAVRATVALDRVLCAFIVGAEASRWTQRDAAERRRDVLDIFAAQFGDEALTPTDYLEADWGADPWSAGCVAGMPPNVLARGARWREAHGLVHLAGTETAVAWPGYMEGAIEAGERAADEVLAALG